MSKELTGRINAYCSVGVIEQRNTELLRECQQRIAELEQTITELGIVRADAECEAEMQTARAVGLEQENSRLQAQLEAAEGLLRELNETSTVLTEKLIEKYFRAKEGKEKA